MQISGFLSYQKTKFADQLFIFEFNTEKSDDSINSYCYKGSFRLVQLLYVWHRPWIYTQKSI